MWFASLLVVLASAGATPAPTPAARWTAFLASARAKAAGRVDPASSATKDR